MITKEQLQEQIHQLLEFNKQNWVYVVIGIFITIIIILYQVIKYYKSVVRKIYCNRCYTTFKNSIVSIHGRTPIPHQLLLQSPTNSVTYIMMLYISNWYYNSNNWKHVFHHGTSAEFSCINKISWDQIDAQCPGVWLDPYKNDMRIVVRTQYVPQTCTLANVSSSSTCSSGDQHLEYVDVTNIDIGKFFQLGIIVENQRLEIYINGDLVRTKILMGTPQFRDSNLYFGLGGSYAGSISNFHYIPEKLTYKDMKRLYAIEKVAFVLK